MHVVTIERRLADNLRSTLIAIESWLVENGIERRRLEIHRGTRPGAVAFTVRFDFPLQADRFAARFPPWLRTAIRASRYPSLAVESRSSSNRKRAAQQAPQRASPFTAG